MPSLLTFFLETLCPVFFVLALGYYAGWRGRIDNRNTTAINTVLMHFALPCSLFLGVARTSIATLRSQGPLFFVLTLVMVAIYAADFLLERRTLRSTAREASVQALTVSFANNVAIGLPLLASLYGSTGVIAVAAAIVSGALIVSPLTLVLLEYDASPAEQSFGQRLFKSIVASVRRPVVLAPIVALLVPIFGLGLPKPIVASADLIGKSTIGLALFLTGLILSAYRPRFSVSVAWGVLLKNLLQPALAAGLLLLFRMHGTLAQECLLLAAVPAGFFGTVFSARYGVDTLHTSSTLLYSTAACVVTLPAAILLTRYFA
jgi:malonate transporter